MHSYLAVLAAGFRRQSTYRFALVGGLGTNVFWGVLRTVVFLALYRQRGPVAGLTVGQALTYVWVGQAMFGAIWVNWLQEFPRSVRSGEFAVELIRPGDPYLRLLAFDLGRNLNQMLVRSTLPLAVAALVLPLVLPTGPAGVLALVVSVLLAAVVGFQLRFLVLGSAFWTADYRFVLHLVFSGLWLASGFVIPTDYFPPALRAVVGATPLHAILMAPFQVAIGRSVAAQLALQAGWVLALAAAGRSLLALAARRLVVHGG
ncbi:MAG TPA: ABC-2 family transporter protein [Actinomycetes bacterium]|nr:ABC-2 family transporter protein [Actinomycetes bacterium]